MELPLFARLAPTACVWDIRWAPLTGVEGTPNCPPDQRKMGRLRGRAREGSGGGLCPLRIILLRQENQRKAKRGKVGKKRPIATAFGVGAAFPGAFASLQPTLLAVPNPESAPSLVCACVDG